MISLNILPAIDIEPALNSSLILSFSITTATTRKRKKSDSFSASGVAISRKRALTALHGKVPLGHPITVTTRNGTQLNGHVEYEKFEENLVDIAVILLDDASEFPNFVEWTDEPVKLTQEIIIVGLKYSSFGDAVNPYAKKSSVDMIEEFGIDSAFLQAAYYSFDGCCGTGVVTSLIDHSVKVIGVHIASHEDTTKACSNQCKF